MPTAEEALLLARSGECSQFVLDVKGRILLYEAGRAVREGPIKT
jgi:hypothetical protein